MFVLSAEGGIHVNKGRWSTHVIIDVFLTKEGAMLAAKLLPPHKSEDETLFITDTMAGTMERVDELP